MPIVQPTMKQPGQWKRTHGFWRSQDCNLEKEKVFSTFYPEGGIKEKNE